MRVPSTLFALAASLALMLALGGIPARAAEASFDCARAGTPVERAICASDALRGLDSAMAALHAALRAALSRAETPALVVNQRSWLADRAGCLEPSDITVEACLDASYRARIRYLADWLDSGAMPDPNGPAPTEADSPADPLAGLEETCATLEETLGPLPMCLDHLYRTARDALEFTLEDARQRAQGEARLRLEAAQSAWEAYSRAECEYRTAVSPREAGETVVMCAIAMTDARVSDLSDTGR